MHENDDDVPQDSSDSSVAADANENGNIPQDSADSVADDGIENEQERELDPDQETTAFVDSKEDMFVDAPEELNIDTPIKGPALTTDDHDTNAKEEDREKELAVLQEHFNLLTAEKSDSKVEEDGNNTVEILSRFSKFLETAEEEKIRHEDALKELRGVISGKDEEIANLTAKSSSSQDEEQQLVAATDRILLSLSNVFGQEEPQHSGSSVSEKIAHLESGVAFLSAKYTEFYYGADQLRKCLSSDEADLRFQEDFGSALGGACSQLLELKEKETSFHERLSHLEDENGKLVEQVNSDREMIESVTAESGKLKEELEQEKTRCINTKEKLSMAVTKGKALVQNRDALKHQISEKTTELENRLSELQEMKTALETCELLKGQLEQSLAEMADELEKRSTELRDKSVSLEACEVAKRELEQSLDEKTKELEECLVKLQALDEAELVKGELVKSEAMVASYQETVFSKSSIIENIETILSHINANSDEGQSLDIIEKVRSLAEEREELQNVSQEYNRLKDLIFSVDLPEEISESSLEARLTWLRESFLQAKDEVSALQNQIERLSMSLSAEMEEKSSIRQELDDVTFRFKTLKETAERDSLEREETVRKLVETSGVMTEGVEHHTVLVDRSLDQIVKKIRDSSEGSYGNEELFERFQSLLYASDVELSLCKEMLGEEMLACLQVNNLSSELASVKEEKTALETDLERSEEKSALLKDKLSMAIKKGKGLVQDREKLKAQLDEKNSEIEKLMLELQELTGTVDSYKNQIDMLSGDSERTKELEAELVAIKEERDELKQSLSLNDTLLQKVMRAVETMSIPVDLATEDSSEKIDRLVEYFKEVQQTRVEEQEELEKAKEEASKLAETLTALKLAEDTLSAAEGNIDRLAEENRQVQAAKELVELDLQKAVGEASSLSSELDEVCATRNTLEAALMQAERNISDIISEKEEAQSSTATAEMELEKVKEEVSDQNNKLTEALITIKSLQDTLTQTESNMNSLSKQIEDDKVLTTDLKNELEALQNEVELERSKMAEASLTIGSLEEALMKAENSLSVLQGEMVKAEVEKSTLSSKLNVCMEELAGSNGNSQSKSMEIIAHLDNLQMALKDGGVISRVNEFLERKFKSLRDIDVIARDIILNFGEKGLPVEMENVTEDDSTVAKSLLSGLDDSVDTELENSIENAADEDEISSSLRKITEGVKLKNKILEKNFEVSSTSIDTLFAALMENMTAARADVINVKGHNESLKEEVRSGEEIVREQEKTIAALETDLSALMSVCGEAARELQLEVKNDLLELVQFQENDNGGGETESTEHPQEILHVSECARGAKELSSATEKACTTLKLFETTSNAAAVLIRDMEERLKEASTALEKVVLERDLNQTKVSSSEAKVESTEALCQDLKLQLENLKAEEEKWHEKEVELSRLYDKLQIQEQEAKENLIPASDMRALFDKINGIEMPPSVDQANGLDPQRPYDVKKLLAIVDSVTKMQHQIDLLSHGQKDLNSTLAEKDLEIQGLKEAAEAKDTTELELVKANKELSKLISGFEKLLGMLAGNDPAVDLDFSESWTLLQALERKIASLLLESESSKSRAQELGLKLVSSEKLVEKLAIKVEEFEDKLQSKAIQPDVVHERSIFEAPRVSSTSEISEMEDKGKKSISAVPTAAQVRVVRKASTDHLAINIDSESEHLMNHNEADEDKGHVFKSLNMSGLVPTQGKMIADRVDGIWVSGGRVLMSRPQARLGVMVYSLLLHLWLLASIL
ncbi:trans-Golgi network-localized SYP41-interacting protein 1 isoform X2 [Raphanus sativus]|uniref:Trans-Golgi network-localized SYP41-interacting protein 1 isoform X2 n=1 Tax=Raphanus sativus TaxID=3726 RepID=A0A9W3C827_RAPSA|nr:trans-Golgi network-localized SYP41-interacting protein 1 isoform X2 [Raphanus sativus]